MLSVSLYTRRVAVFLSVCLSVCLSIRPSHRRRGLADRLSCPFSRLFWCLSRTLEDLVEEKHFLPRIAGISEQKSLCR